ncbi:MAG: NAD(P)/FAD-dependent oxidoreductase [Acidobacteriaceae bacterium]|nr:NAD(P)/FAD-dependent oxidoreductase [Acidobacteriaceae bacterium]
MRHASVIGSGPNGLAAAIVLAQAGRKVDVFEAEEEPGGGARTLPLTLPGFRHDFGSAVHPMAIGSPFFKRLPLADHGLNWIHGNAPLAHPLDDGTAVVLERALADAEAALGQDGKAWRRIVEGPATNWSAFAAEVLGPMLHLPRRPFLLARFGMNAVLPATAFCKVHFRNARTSALFAGMAAHSFLSLDQPLSSAIGLVLGVAAHAVGWPVPRGGAQAITDALLQYLCELGGTVHVGQRVSSLDEIPRGLVLCDVSPRQLLAMAGERLSPSYRRTLSRFQPGPGAFKIDYALSQPIPWKAKECFRAITVHVGGSLEDVAESEKAMASGRHAERPFVLVAQPSLFDPTRAPEGKHTAWAYCHVPNATIGPGVDMTERIENQIERFAPGFRDCVLARCVSTPLDLEARNANLIGGDISGGAMSVGQTLFRPSIRQYATSSRDIYICSSSTPPGGGVHGMCGFYAAKVALRRWGA